MNEVITMRMRRKTVQYIVNTLPCSCR